MTKVCAIVPMFNEEQYAYETISALKQIEDIDTIVAIDDGSSDNTWSILKNIDDIKCLRHYQNMGKAESIRNGINIFEADIYLFADGDLGSSAGELKGLINEVVNDTCDMSVAKLPVINGHGGMGILKHFSKFAVKNITGVDFPCPLSGQRAVKRELLKDSRVNLYFRFGIEVGMLIDILNCGYRVKAVSLDLKHNYTKNDYKGCIHRFRQLIDVAAVFLQCRLRW